MGPASAHTADEAAALSCVAANASVSVGGSPCGSLAPCFDLVWFLSVQPG